MIGNVTLGTMAAAIDQGGDASVLTTTATIASYGYTSIDSTLAPAFTLGSGTYIGQIKVVVCSASDATDSVLSITNHLSGDPTTATFNAVDEAIILMWTGTEWVTISNQGTS